MKNQIVRLVGLTAAALALATTAGAQGKGHDKQVAKSRVKEDRRVPAGVVYRNGDVRDNGTRVPPGLAKKPGQMPPGQYKKRYGTNEGADVLGGVLRRRGYSVLRVVPAGDSRYVYYRLNNGTDRKSVV